MSYATKYHEGRHSKCNCSRSTHPFAPLQSVLSNINEALQNSYRADNYYIMQRGGTEA